MATVGLHYADRLQIAMQSRHQAIKHMFNENIAQLSSLLGPMNDGPEWPSGAAWLVSLHDDHACIISDGLSDPWVERDKPETGLGVEVFIEAPQVKIPDDQDLTRLADTWMFPMIAEISHTMASNPRLSEKLLAGDVLSMEFNIDHIKDGRGRVGALLHSPKNMENRWQNEFGEIQLVAATLLNPDELHYMRGKKQAGKQAMLARLYEAGIDHRSLAARPSVVPVE